MSIPQTGREFEIWRAVGVLQPVIGQNAQGLLAFVSREALKFATSELGIEVSVICLSNEPFALRN